MDSFINSFFLGQLNYDWAALLLRLAIGIALLPYGIKKFRERHEMKSFPAVLGMSSRVSFCLAMTVETLASVCMILGLWTRLAAIPAIVNMGIATNVSRGQYFTSPAQAYLLGFIAILLVGPGKYSLDYLIFGTL